MRTQQSLNSLPSFQMSLSEFKGHALILAGRSKLGYFHIDPSAGGGRHEDLKDELLAFRQRQPDAAKRSSDELLELTEIAVDHLLREPMSDPILDFRVENGRHVILVDTDVYLRHGPEQVLRTVHLGRVKDARDNGLDVPSSNSDFYAEELSVAIRDV